jgi:hypothetical protein
MNRAKRLDFTRRNRTVPVNARSSADAIMHLAHVARERLRLEQERVSLERRVAAIKARLTAIAGTETRLVPLIQASRPPAHGVAAAAPAIGRPLPAGTMEVTLQY